MNQDPDSGAQREMPRYKSHKEIHALKISAIEIHEDKSATISPADEGYSPFKTEVGWADRFKGDESDKGYYVVYKDGYTTWSPVNAFQDGYTPITNSATFGIKDGSHLKNALESMTSELKSHIQVKGPLSEGGGQQLHFTIQSDPVSEVGVNGCQAVEILENFSSPGKQAQLPGTGPGPP